MTQNIEIEFKNILTKNEYEHLLKFFKVDTNQIFKQENHYFDTPNFSLKSKETALRIRKKGLNFEMTLKQPADVGLLETNQTISEAEAQLAFRFGKLPIGIIQRLIEESEIPFSTLEYFGSLITERVEFEYQKGLLVLDHSIYLDTEDYELEYEVKNYQNGEKIFIELLEQFKIPARLTENKIRRFYNRKYQQTNQ
ncbi:CYTH domain-containing protein [Neobacillus sp. SuZ13]|uniref:CYTH domain-containing protein n=1 Tax=Neobacillus sp. SuZ13 TaxID=3047875 RepID=UPI0024BFE912|nr:CYTH domain-containing protein [Neobacillus sp. SuZ13]WHY68377.1 CYTH domain-containing protein [Neobacillus sp. SuZ13]